MKLGAYGLFFIFLIGSIALFAFSISQPKFFSENKDPLQAVAAVIAAVAIGFWAVQKAIFEKSVELQKPFLERQMALCLEAVQVTSVIATSQNEGTRQAAEGRFWELYWGALAVVEDRELEGAMVEFGKIVRGTSKKSLEGAALHVSHATRALLKSAHEVSLGTLAGLKEKTT